MSASTPSAAGSRSARTSGVFPSPSVTTGVRSVTGRNDRYCSMIPFQLLVFIARSIGHSLDPQADGLVAHHIELVDSAKRPLHVAFDRLMGQYDDRDGALLMTSLLDDRDDADVVAAQNPDRKSTRLNSSHHSISYAVF